MVRQLGGSIGIALITTFISTRTAMHYSNLNENVTLTDPNTQDRIKMLSGAMVSKGYDTHSATQSAYSMISRIITQQATFLTYKDLFLYLGLFFLILIPLLIMFRNKKKPEHVEELTEWALE